MAFQDVSEIVAALRAAGGVARSFDGQSFASPKPLAPDRLAPLLGPGDGEPPLPDELRTWLAFDASWLPLLDEDGEWLEISPRGFAEDQVAEVAEEIAGAGIDDWDPDDAVDQIVSSLGDDELADAPAIRLPGSASQEHLLVLHHDKLFVLGYEKEELWVKYPTFAAFLAAYFGLV
jgi:hypothetical protein